MDARGTGFIGQAEIERMCQLQCFHKVLPNRIHSQHCHRSSIASLQRERNVLPMPCHAFVPGFLSLSPQPHEILLWLGNVGALPEACKARRLEQAHRRRTQRRRICCNTRPCAATHAPCLCRRIGATSSSPFRSTRRSTSAASCTTACKAVVTPPHPPERLFASLSKCAVDSAPVPGCPRAQCR